MTNHQIDLQQLNALPEVERELVIDFAASQFASDHAKGIKRRYYTIPARPNDSEVVMVRVPAAEIIKRRYQAKL